MYVMIIALEQAAQHRLALCVGYEDFIFAAGAHFTQHGREPAGDRTAHAGMKTRVLAQQGGKQGRARARQAGNEMDTLVQRRAPRALRPVASAAMRRPILSLKSTG